jgi:hypothetical protein
MRKRDAAGISCERVSLPRARMQFAMLVVLVLSGCSNSKVSEETGAVSSPDPNTHQSRYLQICTQDYAVGGDRRAQRVVCECAYQISRKRLNDVEMEMLIAKRSKDKQKQLEIRARQDYSEAAFHKNMKGSTEEAIACATAKAGT